MVFHLQLAETVFQINARFSETYNMCKNYIVPDSAKVFAEISATEDELLSEASKMPHADYCVKNLKTVENLVLYRKIAELMLDNSAFLMHGAVVAVDDAAFMFTAKSGVGKTTHILKWLENAQGCFVVNGDKPIIKLTDSEAIAYGTPWCGKERLGTNTGVPLRAIVFMERDENNAIEEIPFSKVLPNLMQQIYRPCDAEKMLKTLALISALDRKVRFYRFCFNNLKPDAFCTAYEALTGKSV